MTLAPGTIAPSKTTSRKPRFFRHSYAQEGEDLILAEIFQSKRNGFFVDVGAHHPKRFSNTYHFYRFRGWRGINIDAAPGSMKAFRRARPEDINVEAAVSDTCQTLDFFIFNEAALNTFDPDLAAQRDGASTFKLIQKIPIVTKTLTSLLETHVPPGKHIDFLTVDVEGLDLNVLKSNDWQMYRPAIVMVEDITVSNWKQIGGSPVTTYLAKWDYEPFASTFRTIMYRQSGN